MPHVSRITSAPSWSAPVSAAPSRRTSWRQPAPLSVSWNGAKRYPPGSFPRSPYGMARNFWDPSAGRYGLFDVWSFPLQRSPGCQRPRRRLPDLRQCPPAQAGALVRGTPAGWHRPALARQPRGPRAALRPPSSRCWPASRSRSITPRTLARPRRAHSRPRRSALDCAGSSPSSRSLSRIPDKLPGSACPCRSPTPTCTSSRARPVVCVRSVTLAAITAARTRWTTTI